MFKIKPLGPWAACAALSCAASAHAVTIDFEGLPEFTAVSNQFDGVIFSSSGGSVEAATYGASTWGTDGPTIICPLGDVRGYCSANLSVSFVIPVTNLSYRYTGDDVSGLVGQAAYYDASNALITRHNLYGDGVSYTAGGDGLSYVPGIGRLVITLSASEADANGLGYDDFSFNPTSAVPEPETYALMAAGLGVMAFARRRRAA